MTENSAENQPAVEAKKPSAFKRIRRFSFENAIYRALSEKWCGNDCVPLDHRTLRVENDGCRYVFSFLNDSFEIGIGWPDQWHGIYRREVIHEFIWWYLRQWIFSEWLGLRRSIWYWLLHRKCGRWNRHGLRGRA